MDQKTYNVLFICTGNSARSILAEALMNQLGDGRFRAFSAGSHPKGEVHPLTLKTLAAQRLPVDGYRSKSWEEFARLGSPELHFVFTVCDQAAGEVCPVWPGQPITAHWGMPDPAAAPEAQREQAFVDTFVTMKRRIQLMLALPLASLDRVALKTRVTDIGKN
ncbi:arsenate reductase ArsC [Rubrivivax gelatinosus]|uniref:Protein-tyrosine-phosphatase n=1 Tax=Rubrivivax gelatinosus TaxID=28068 RepID=A0A4R2M4L5_RUBGE|nr:arsenate reductase ArsC [Rubrivivax gelatinosus]MBK1687310.1 protein-tyrosine-phosphatase [Rubrivivax gelatinosus]TCO99754.1 protein-tyrosine-phosphatase [Rubrivivax gelatinosus]